MGEHHGDTLDINVQREVQGQLSRAKRETGDLIGAEKNLNELKRLLASDKDDGMLERHVLVKAEEIVLVAQQGRDWNALVPTFFKEAAKLNDAFNEKSGAKPKTSADKLVTPHGTNIANFLFDSLEKIQPKIELDIKPAVVEAKKYKEFAAIAELAMNERMENHQATQEAAAAWEKKKMWTLFALVIVIAAIMMFMFLEG